MHTHHLILTFVLYAAAIAAASKFIPKVRVRGIAAVAVTVLVFGVLNFFLGWLLHGVADVLLFVPAVLTLGLAWLLVPFLVNLVLVWVTDWLVEGFEAAGLAAKMGTAAFLVGAHVVSVLLQRRL